MSEPFSVRCPSHPFAHLSPPYGTASRQIELLPRERAASAFGECERFTWEVPTGANVFSFLLRDLQHGRSALRTGKRMLRLFRINSSKSNRAAQCFVSISAGNCLSTLVILPLGRWIEERQQEKAAQETPHVPTHP